MQVFHPTFHPRRASSRAGLGVQQAELKIARLVAVGEKGDPARIGREPRQAIRVRAESQDTRATRGQVNLTDTSGRKALEAVHDTAREHRFSAVGRGMDFNRVTDLSRARLS